MAATIPETMQAVQLQAYGEPLTTRRVPVPRPGPGQVLVRMAAAPVNPSDLSALAGNYAAYERPLPATPGIEGSGTVVDAGPGLLGRWLKGKRVACAAVREAGGTWAEYMITSAKTCIPLLGDVSLEQGAMLVVNPLTVLAFFEIAKQERHAAIVNTAAASALGRMMVRVGQDQGVPIVNIVRRQEQVELLRSLGAEHILDSSSAGFDAKLAALADELDATLYLDAIGGGMTDRLLASAPHGSHIILYANLSGEPATIQVNRLYNEEKRLSGFYLANWAAGRSLAQTLLAARRAQSLLATQLQSPVQGYFSLAAADQAVRLYENNMTAGKVLLVADASAVGSVES